MPESIESAVLLFSGGLDSVAYMLLMREHTQVHLLGINYYQKSSELVAARYWARKYGLDYQELTINGSVLWDSSLMTGQPAAEANAEGWQRSRVEGRNVVFAVLAAAYASKVGATHVILGLHQKLERSPMLDTTDKYFRNLNDVIAMTWANRVLVSAPYCHVSKSDLATLAYGKDSELFSKTVSCYEGVDCEECTHCLKKKELHRLVLSRFPVG